MLSDLARGLRELDEAEPGYREAHRYYEGNVDEIFASPRVRRAIAKSGVWRKFNLAKTPVNALANRIAITSVTATGNPQATATIAALRKLNRLHLEENQIHRKTFMYGDGYLFVWPIFDSDAPGAAPTSVRMIWNTPECTRTIYDDDDPSTPLYTIKSWDEGSGDSEMCRADLYYPDGTIERYVRRAEADAEWAEYLDDGQDEWLITHPYGMPFFHFRTETPHGTPEHADAYGPQDAINKLLITHLSTVDYQGYRQRYALLDPKSVLDESTDDPDWDDDADDVSGVDTTGGVGSGMRSGPGTMLTLPGVRAMGEFSAADPAVFITPVDLYVRLMSQVTGTPLYDFDPSKDQPSGIARKRAETPLIDKAGTRIMHLAATWIDVWRHCLAILGTPADDIDVTWKPLFVIDDKDGWGVLTEKMKAGVPRRHALMEAGYTTEQLDEWGVTNTPTSQPVQRQASGMQSDLDWGLFGAKGNA